MNTKWYSCDISYITYGTAHVQAESLEEAKELFKERTCIDVIKEQSDERTFELDTIKEEE